jgi:hypothetical protein
MYLRNAPIVFEKDGETCLVYHTVTADELTQFGWKAVGPESGPSEEGGAITPEATREEQVITPVDPEPEPEPEPESEAEADGPVLTDMTKNQLIEYASANSIAINPYSTKSEILGACLEASND